MDRKSIFNLGKNIINTAKEKLLNHSEEMFRNENDDAKYKDAQNFENEIESGLHNIAINAISSPVEATIVLKELITSAKEVAKFTEVQKTIRKEIEVNRDKYVTSINAQKEIMLAYLDKTFDERRENFDQLFKVVDHALETNNPQELALVLESINRVAASSPFKDLASIGSTQKALEDKDHIWDI
jgi:ribonucleotide reductase alpha subunit